MAPSSTMKKRAVDNRSAARALDILELFAEQKRPLFVTEMSKILKTPISSCFHLLNTLETCGYAYSLGPRRGYYLTNKILRLASEVADHDPLHQIFGPTLRALRDETKETILLAQLIQSQIVALYVCQSPQRIRFTGEVGEIWPVHSSSMGRAILGLMPEAQRRGELAKADLVKFNSTTVTDPEKILRIIEDGNARGWHMGKGETISDLCGVAMAVSIMGQQFAISVTGPVYRITQNLDEHITALENTCKVLREEL